MEPSGRNQWQPVANGKARKRLKQAQTVVTGCDQLPEGAHRKEEVDHSQQARRPSSSGWAGRCLGRHQYDYTPTTQVLPASSRS